MKIKIITITVRHYIKPRHVTDDRGEDKQNNGTGAAKIT